MSGNDPLHVLADDRLIPFLSRMPSFEEALARLLYLVEHRRPCGMVLGPAGTGKSALLQVLFQELSGSPSQGTLCRPLLIDLRASRHADLGWAIATEMGLSPDEKRSPESHWRLIEDRFQGAAMSGQPIVPMIDHLERMDAGDTRSLIRCCHLAVQYESTLLLSAQPPLDANITEIVGPMNELRIELPTWTPAETTEFVSQVSQEAAAPRVSEEASEAIHCYAEGRLRETVQLMRLAAFAASAEGVDAIDADLLRTVAEQLWRSDTRICTPRINRLAAVEMANDHN